MKTSCEFRFGFWDVTARTDAVFAVSQNQDYARIEDINKEESITLPRAVTLEPDFGWPLDGSKEWLPDNTSATSWGWWSTDLSQSDKSFSDPPTLIVTFIGDNATPTPHSSAGITLDFYATLPSGINIKWYGGQGQELANVDFVPDRFRYFCQKQVEDYYKVVLTVGGMAQPQRFLRITGILFGALEIIGDTRVTKATLTEEISPATLTVPINTLEVDFFTPDGRFSLLDPQGAYQLFQWKQKIEAYKTVDGVRTFLGLYYLQKATGTADPVTQLSCVDIVGVLDKIEYKGGIYENVSVQSFLAQLLQPEGIAFDLAPAFAALTLSGYLPICTKRKAIQQIAFAIGAMIDPTRGEVIRFYPLPTTPTASIAPNRKLIGHQITMEELVTQVEVTAHTYLLSNEPKVLTKTALGPGSHTITFSNPASVATVTGAVLTNSHANYCVVTVVTAGEVVLSGYEYLDVATIHMVKTDPLPSGAKSSSKKVSAATLVDPSKAGAVAQRMYAFYQNRYTDEGQVLPGDERAAMRATISNLGGKAITGNIGRIVTDLSGGCIQTISVRGAT